MCLPKDSPALQRSTKKLVPKIHMISGRAAHEFMDSQLGPTVDFAGQSVHFRDETPLAQSARLNWKL
jgi:hypothetical protein